MSQHASLDQVARSMDLGFMADEVLQALSQTQDGRARPPDTKVLREAQDFLEAAQRGQHIVQSAAPAEDGIAAAVDNAKSFRDAQQSIAALRRRESASDQTEMGELLRRLIGDMHKLVEREALSGTEFTFVVSFFDALASVTLRETSELLERQSEDMDRSDYLL